MRKSSFWPEVEPISSKAIIYKLGLAAQAFWQTIGWDGLFGHLRGLVLAWLLPFFISSSREPKVPMKHNLLNLLIELINYWMDGGSTVGSVGGWLHELM